MSISYKWSYLLAYLLSDLQDFNKSGKHTSAFGYRPPTPESADGFESTPQADRNPHSSVVVGRWGFSLERQTRLRAAGKQWRDCVCLRVSVWRTRASVAAAVCTTRSKLASLEGPGSGRVNTATDCETRTCPFHLRHHNAVSHQVTHCTHVGTPIPFPSLKYRRYRIDTYTDTRTGGSSSWSYIGGDTGPIPPSPSPSFSLSLPSTPPLPLSHPFLSAVPVFPRLLPAFSSPPFSLVQLEGLGRCKLLSGVRGYCTIIYTTLFAAKSHSMIQINNK